MKNRKLHKAFANDPFPVNPLPFITELREGVISNGMAFIKSNEAKGLLLTLNMMAYGRPFNLHSKEEHDRLKHMD